MIDFLVFRWNGLDCNHSCDTPISILDFHHGTCIIAITLHGAFVDNCVSAFACISFNEADKGTEDDRVVFAFGAVFLSSGSGHDSDI